MTELNWEAAFKLTLYKDNKVMLEQYYDTLPLARKAGNYFLTTSEQDGIRRGYKIDDIRFDLEVIKKGDVPNAGL